MLDFIVKYWLEFLFSVVITVITYFVKNLRKRIKEQEEKNKAIENGVQALLRNELVQNYREYKAKGEITIIDRENMGHMFEEYKKLGGNGTVKELMDELLKVPTKIIKY